MTINRVRGPSPGTTYNGFADGPAPEARAPVERIYVPPPPQRRYELRAIDRGHQHRTRNLLLAGVGGVLVLGLFIGVLAQPNLTWFERAIAPMPVPPPPAVVNPAEPVASGAEPLAVPTTASPPLRADQLRVEIAPPRAETRAPAPSPVMAAVSPPPVATGPAQSTRLATIRNQPRSMPVLRPETRAPAPAQRTVSAPPAPAQLSVSAGRRIVSEPAPEPARTQVQLPVIAEAAPPPATPAVRPSFDCRYARTASERMVCGDPELASYDRQLNGAFERAIRSGVPRRVLRADQDDWLGIREDAARYSRQAVLNVYRQRISELNALARQP